MSQERYKWFILALSTVSAALVVAVPFSCMPSLFDEIANDLGLSLVQIGTVWGMASLAGVFVSIIGGYLSDRFGVKLIISLSCLAIGITGALRGFADSFFLLSASVFIFGLARALMPVNMTKSIGIWFRGERLGMANGILSMGMGAGLMLGPLVSATFLSPLLGGWRNVMLFYGAIGVVISIVWFILGREPVGEDGSFSSSGSISIREAVSGLMKNKTLWLLSIALMFRGASVIGVTGYLPLYLRGEGWSVAGADGTLSAFYAASSLMVIPLAALSDRLGSRKKILFPALAVSVICFSLIPLVDGAAVWVLMIAAGMFMDGFMAVIITMILETSGISFNSMGIALGLVFTITQLGGVLSPPLGNSFAGIDPGLPFIFWMSLNILSAITLMFCKEKRWGREKAVELEVDAHLVG